MTKKKTNKNIETIDGLSGRDLEILQRIFSPSLIEALGTQPEADEDKDDEKTWPTGCVEAPGDVAYNDEDDEDEDDEEADEDFDDDTYGDDGILRRSDDQMPASVALNNLDQRLQALELWAFGRHAVGSIL